MDFIQWKPIWLFTSIWFAQIYRHTHHWWICRIFRLLVLYSLKLNWIAKQTLLSSFTSFIQFHPRFHLYLSILFNFLLFETTIASVSVATPIFDLTTDFLSLNIWFLCFFGESSFSSFFLFVLHSICLVAFLFRFHSFISIVCICPSPSRSTPIIYIFTSIILLHTSVGSAVAATGIVVIAAAAHLPLTLSDWAIERSTFTHFARLSTLDIAMRRVAQKKQKN